MDRLAEIFGKENVLKDEPMSRHTTFRIGGAADFFVKVQTISQLQEAMRYLKKEQIPFYIVGNGSNLLVRDEGVRGVVLQLGAGRKDVMVCVENWMWVPLLRVMPMHI